MPLLALAQALALALSCSLSPCHRAHVPPRLRPVPPRGKAARVGSALRADLAIPRNKKAGDPGISHPAPGLCFCPPCQRVNLSTCQLVLPSGPLANSSTGQLTRCLLPPCHHAHVPPLSAAALPRAQINPDSSAMVSNLCSRRSILTCRSVTFLDSSSFWTMSCWRRERICSLEVLLFTMVMHGCVRSSHSVAGMRTAERRGFPLEGRGSGRKA